MLETPIPTIKGNARAVYQAAEAIAAQFVRADEVLGARGLFEVGIIGLVRIVGRDLLGKDGGEYEHEQNRQSPRIARGLRMICWNALYQNDLGLVSSPKSASAVNSIIWSAIGHLIAIECGGQVGIKDVIDEIDENDHDREYEHGVGDDQVVAGEDGVDRQAADAWPAEDFLDDDAPPSRLANWPEMTVKTGIEAFGMACRKLTRRAPMPLACAVRT